MLPVLQDLPGRLAGRLTGRLTGGLTGEAGERDSSEVSLFCLISHYRIGLLPVVNLSLIDAPCRTGARDGDSGQLPV